MTCKQLGGACDKEFHGTTFAEIAEQSKKHAMEMVQAGDQAHFQAMDRMKKVMSDPKATNEWMENKKKEFAALPDE